MQSCLAYFSSHKCKPLKLVYLSYLSYWSSKISSKAYTYNYEQKPTQAACMKSIEEMRTYSNKSVSHSEIPLRISLAIPSCLLLITRSPRKNAALHSFRIRCEGKTRQECVRISPSPFSPYTERLRG